MGGVGKQHPLSAEKLSPVLSLYFVKDFAAGMETVPQPAAFGGLGHTCVIYSQDDARIREYALRMPAFRVLVNTPAPQGSTGITTNVFPSMTLGCGAVAGNITRDNIGPLHLINIKRLAYAVRKPEEAFEMPPAQAGSAAPKMPPPSSSTIQRETLVTAVERYLDTRGIAISPAAGKGALSKSNVAAQVVDRFLSTPPFPTPGPQPPKPLRLPPAAPEIPISTSSARPTCARPSRASEKSTSGPRPSSHRRPASWAAALIFWCWPRAEARTVDLNLDTLKREILEYLESSGFAVFHSHPGGLEGLPMVTWDTERYPDYQMFLEARGKSAAR